MSYQDARWWKKFTGLDFMIKYKTEKKNPANSFFQHSDYMNPSNELIYSIEYIMKNLIKAQKNENSQVFQKSEIISESELDLEN